MRLAKSGSLALIVGSGTRAAPWIPLVFLLASILLGLAGKARAAPERDAEAVADRGRTPALFLPLTPAMAGQPDSIAKHSGPASPASPLAAEEPPPVEASVRVLRSRAAGVDVPLLAGVRKAVAEGRPAQLRLNLFSDVNLNAVIERTADTRSGYSLSGRIEGQPHSGVTLVVNGDILAGAVHSQQGAYVIAFRNGPIHTIREIVGDLKCGSRADLTGRWLGKTRAPSTRNAIFGGIFGDNGSEVDVLVLFTEAALAVEGGLLQMRAGIDLAVAFTNDAYEASGVNFRLNLVAAAPVDYQESKAYGSAGLSNQDVDLRQLIDPADGLMDEAHALRDRYAADVIHLIVDQSGEAGWPNSCVRMRRDPAAWAFAVSNSVSPWPAFVAHELGHVMGLLHDRYTEVQYDGIVVPTISFHVRARLREPARVRKRRTGRKPLADDHGVQFAMQ